MTRLASSLLVSLSVIGLGVGRLPQAHACSAWPRPGLIRDRQVLPTDGATGVPTNTRIYVGYDAYGPDVTDHPRLRTADGIEVPASVQQALIRPSSVTYDQTYMLAPTSPLQPNTKYQVVSDFASVPCLQDLVADYPGSTTPLCQQAGIDAGVALGIDGGVLPPGTVITSFTTGAGPDTVAPVLTGKLTYANAYRMSCTNGACCGPYEGWDATLSWTKPADVSSPVFYELLHDGATLLLPIQDSVVDPAGTGVATLRGIFLCSGSVPVHPLLLENASFVGGSGLYDIYAVDQAGNRSQPLQVQVTVDCSTSTDGGVDSIGLPDVPRDLPTPDSHGTGGATASAGTGGALGSGGGSGASSSTIRPDGSAHDVIKPRDSGCSCRIGGSPNAAAALALLAFGMVLAQRLRRRR